jgi:phage shock protein C
MNKKLYRDEYHKVLGGVCAGLAEYFEMDVTIVRLLFAFTFFIMGVGLIPYIVLWIVLPRKDYTFNNPKYNNPTVDYTVPPPTGSTFTPPPPAGDPFGRTYSSAAPGFTPVGIPPKPRSNAGVIFGMVLIILGAIIFIDEFDLIPDFDFGRMWPIILLFIGAALIVSGRKKQPWHKPDWNAGDAKENGNAPVDTPPADNAGTAENTTVEP